MVDDDPQIRRVMKATLVGHGYEVTEVRTGEEALEGLAGDMPNLVLLDMNMPGMGVAWKTLPRHPGRFRHSSDYPFGPQHGEGQSRRP